MKHSTKARDIATESRRILTGSGALGVISGLIDWNSGHHLMALVGLGAAAIAALIYPLQDRNK